MPFEPTLMAEKLRGALEAGVAGGVFTGAQAGFFVDNDCQVVWAGDCGDGPRTKVDRTTRFDVASLTKLFTAHLTLQAAAMGKIGLDVPLAETGFLFPLESSFSAVSPADLLAHEAGLLAWKPFFKTVEKDRWGTELGRQKVVDLVLKTPVDGALQGTANYSDLGYIALGAVLEHLFGAPLEVLVKRRISKPLALGQTGYGPIDPLTGTVVSTGTCPVFNQSLVGVVHDDNARAMGGVAGHAGIFSTVDDLLRFGQCWLGIGATPLHVPRRLLRLATTRRPSGRGLGVDFWSEVGSSAGRFAHKDVFGHLGYTGCSVWMDPRHRAVVVLLTNRVRCSDNNSAIKAFRPRFHDIFFEELASSR